MPLKTRLTERLGLAHPVVSAPMAGAGGGALAAAVSAAGGLGLIGGGYGDAEWLEREFAAAGNQRVGCGFITWSMARAPALLDLALAHRPAALMLSFGDPRPFAGRIREARAMLVCQVQTMRHVREALEAGAEIIVAQGSEAGGHGARRATLTLVPEVADLLARESPQTLLLAAGGIADGRGLAAALMLGADGVLMGSRFWASREALVHPNLQAAAVAADGDHTVRTSTIDIARRLDWPKPFDIRVLVNGFVARWHGREAELAAAIEEEAPRYAAASASGDAEGAGIVVGEATGLIADVPPAGEIVTRIVAEAEALLARRAPAFVAPS
ncbi:nitronate monooxygenase [Chelatococcus sp. SYSU_G07232]|uniref:Nitronate monooxygenase n=1 Tax=Chelatococcus albus TaxID=3047466 RepID=A0ABT7AK98_9HYPH|nr:nitronate monooxygenase [Chelatococcus sp. SYSU_G07232]MDJ1159412.1 nitronate monooxygenase [Chelatococcus sp. SYSU_G07232]